ncbi:hypothetical protein DPMN_168896 [Dreissena polymorpha]|uniref:Uncharacterized protein n=1 Tax=Dreissena polymorpha TaxID=45954 RepID=A0A9D4F1I6_DREPO|nr:hypothetical protein DPMN_168896 [Dreissena polymorpha]
MDRRELLLLPMKNSINKENTLEAKVKIAITLTSRSAVISTHHRNLRLKEKKEKRRP